MVSSSLSLVPSTPSPLLLLPQPFCLRSQADLRFPKSLAVYIHLLETPMLNRILALGGSWENGVNIDNLEMLEILGIFIICI